MSLQRLARQNNSNHLRSTNVPFYNVYLTVASQIISKAGRFDLNEKHTHKLWWLQGVFQKFY